MKLTYHITFILIGMFSISNTWGQEIAAVTQFDDVYIKARNLAYEGKHAPAQELLGKLTTENPDNDNARYLLANTHSWMGNHTLARKEYNAIISRVKDNRNYWIATIKNELYAKEPTIALGLAKKAMKSLKNDVEIERLHQLAIERVKQTEYPERGWHNTDSEVPSKAKTGQSNVTNKKKDKESTAVNPEEKKDEKNVLNNRIDVSNSFTIFTERYEPFIFSSVSYRRQTLAGSIIPRINYSNRLGKHGLQYDIDFYPKFSKRFYAYLNYGYSNATIYPKHKMGGDLYVNLPAALEFSAGGRYIVTNTQNVTGITNSLGHYRGNYYFSLRSFITPKPDGLTRVSGNLLVRRYLRDADNFLGGTIGMGVSPELRQFFAEDRLLAETIFFVESQYLNLEYQFATKKSPENIYRARLGVRRQELSFEPGSFFWGVTAGLTYQVKF